MTYLPSRTNKINERDQRKQSGSTTSIDQLKTPRKNKEQIQQNAEGGAGGVVEGVMVRPAWDLNWPYKALPVVSLCPPTHVEKTRYKVYSFVLNTWQTSSQSKHGTASQQQWLVPTCQRQNCLHAFCSSRGTSPIRGRRHTRESVLRRRDPAGA
jgi:hypothetical protein